MLYDLKLLHEFCQELGFTSYFSSDEKLEIKFSEYCVLIFWNNYNSNGSDECIMGFKIEDSGRMFNWHVHGGIMFSDGIQYIEMDALDILAGLKDGTVLICEIWREGKFDNRLLMHHKITKLFADMDKGEEIKVLRLNI